LIAGYLQVSAGGRGYGARLNTLNLLAVQRLSGHVLLLFFNLYFASDFSCATLSFGMISIATKRITMATSMSITSTKTKSTIFASGAWRNS
jgi:hypothetical protein